MSKTNEDSNTFSNENNTSNKCTESGTSAIPEDHEPSLGSLIMKQNNCPQYIPGNVPTTFPDAKSFQTNTISLSNTSNYDDTEGIFNQPTNKCEYLQRAYGLPRHANISNGHQSLNLDQSLRKNRTQSLSLIQPEKLVYNRTSENDFVTQAMDPDNNEKKKDKDPKKEKEKEKKNAKAKKATLRALDFFTDNVIGFVAPVPLPNPSQINDMVNRKKEKKKREQSKKEEKENREKDKEIKNDDDDHITDPNFITEKALDSEGHEIDPDKVENDEDDTDDSDANSDFDDGFDPIL